MSVRSFRDLDVWHLSMQLAEDTCHIIRRFPIDERYGLSLQLRKATVSIPSNLAEGSGYGTNRRYVHHLRIASGSTSEVQTQLELAERLKFASPDEIRPLLKRASQVGRMLNGLIQSLDAHYASKEPIPDP
jgi:four helix bundle protein